MKKTVYRRSDWKEKIRKEAKAYKERHKREMEELVLPYLRDMFAGEALRGMIKGVLLGDSNAPKVRAKIAAECYLFADAMMAARRPSIPNPKRSKPKETK